MICFENTFDYCFFSLGWLLFWIAGLPDYYQQYPIKFMVIFDLAIYTLFHKNVPE